MIASLAELIILSLIVDWLFRRLTIPGLVGMLLLGILLGPYVMGWISQDLLAASNDFRLIALIVILLRAGFELSKDTLNRVGGRTLVLSAVPAVVEGAAVTLLGPPLLGLTYMESAILGSVLAAVSPAVVVPLMIRYIERGMGAEKGIPTMVLAASALDDVFVIVIYSVLIGIHTGSTVNVAWQLAGIPISILLGIAVGLGVGMVLYRLFRHFDPRATKRVLVVLGLSVLLVRAEHWVEAWVPFAALLAVMAMGFIILEKDEHTAHEISAKLGKIWIFAEIALFTMVGAQVNLEVAFNAGLAGAAIIVLGLVARSVGTYGCLLGSDLTAPERMFVVISYLPKATVQAAIGGAPLAALALAGMNTDAGEVILAVAVLSIVLTAPLGAWAITITGDRVLQVAPANIHDARDAAVESDPHADEF
jgi:NhaP-type Na+/H+ or K+/H+ antiporter